MLSRMEKSRAIKAEADRLHQSYLQAKEKARAMQQEITLTVDEARQRRREILQEDQRRQQQAEENLREEIEKKATEKLKKGQKLTWEEFQVLAQKGIDTEEKSQ